MKFLFDSQEELESFFNELCRDGSLVCIHYVQGHEDVECTDDCMACWKAQCNPDVQIPVTVDRPPWWLRTPNKIEGSAPNVIADLSSPSTQVIVSTPSKPNKNKRVYSPTLLDSPSTPFSRITTSAPAFLPSKAELDMDDSIIIDSYKPGSDAFIDSIGDEEVIDALIKANPDPTLDWIPPKMVTLEDIKRILNATQEDEQCVSTTLNLTTNSRTS